MDVYYEDVYDSKGLLIRLDFFSKNDSSFQFQAMWDDRDAQTSENRENFRNWACGMAKSMGFKVVV